jgi:putative ABC transport system ATP-binding protein
MVKQGELFMLVGPSGCGKTTLISIVAAILNPDSGSCNVCGIKLTEISEREKTLFRQKNIGFVFQSFNLIPSLNARENVSVPLLIAGQSRTTSLQRADELLERVGLKEKIKNHPKDLSGGQQQRVAIARALVHNPRIIVCDEPTSALDHETGSKVLELFKEVAVSGGRTLLIVTHDQRIFEYADRIAKMDDGRVTEVTSK